MKAMLLRHLGPIQLNRPPLNLQNVPDPIPAEDEILIKISCCGVCHTELDEIEGRLPPPKLPVIPGHQVVGTVAECRRSGKTFRIGERVGVAWINSACGKCSFCLSGQENLCPTFRATGKDANGGYAEYMTVGEDFAYRIPDAFSDAEAAPLLCAGAIGYRSLRLAQIKDGESIGLAGFGASAHLVIKMIRSRYPKSRVFVFSRSDTEKQFALELGASWAGNYDERSPEKLRSVIDTTPAWMPIVKALGNLEPGGRVVVNAIRKEESDKNALLQLNYPSDLWMEKEIQSVANVTRADVQEFLTLASIIPIKPEVGLYPLEEANEALTELKERKIHGAKVLTVRHS
ncbi:MAG TPA: zinc-dependent alcohol dehydrogenase family protein [Bacteroidota bacterium]|nr:zinc-dependent alcohol dehydrogenase family protein [Bacteroidota bacterium]